MGSACSCSDSGSEEKQSLGQDMRCTQNGHLPEGAGGESPFGAEKGVVEMNGIAFGGERHKLSSVSEGELDVERGAVRRLLERIPQELRDRLACDFTDEEFITLMAADLGSLLSRLESAVERLERVGLQAGVSSAKSPPIIAFGGGPPQVNDEKKKRVILQWGEACTVPFVVAYDELLSGPFKTFLDCSIKIGGDVAEIAKLVEQTFKTQRAFLVTAAKSQKPSETELPKVLGPTGKKIQEVIGYRESHRTSPFFNHLSAISESIPGLSWVAIEPAPAPYVKEMGDAAVFYTNRVLKDYRETDKMHVEWVNNWNSVFKELQDYIKQHHTAGIVWNPRGGSALENTKAPVEGGSIPPPPPAGSIPPPPPMIKLEPKSVIQDDGHAALFADINKGTDITSGLRKVPDEMKTHKNPSLREGPKPFVKSDSKPAVAPAPVVNAQPPTQPPTQPPRIVLEGKKWFVEYQKDAPNLIINKTQMDHSVYIYRCERTVIQVKGKINSIVLDSCKKTSVVFDTLVSSIEIVNCQSCQAQVMQTVPTIAIEKTDGCQIYLSTESLATEIITAKSSEMNIMIPVADGDFVECPVPEQFKTTINGRKLVTSCTEKAA